MKNSVVSALAVIGRIMSAVGVVLWLVVLPTIGLMWWAGQLK